MTVAGIVVEPGGGAALAWADSARHALGSGKRVRDTAKISVNSVVGALAVGAGLGAVLDAGRAAVLACDDADRLLRRVANAMRQAAQRVTDRTEAIAPYSFAHTTMAIAMRSPAFGRLVVWKLSGASNFVPHMSTRWTMPELDTSNTPMSFDSVAVISAAHRQLRQLRNSDPMLGGGRLVVAELRPPAWCCGAIYDMDADAALSIDGEYSTQHRASSRAVMEAAA